MLTEILVSIGFIFIIEGILYALFPNHMKSMMKTIMDMDDNILKYVGMIAIIFGAIIIWVVKTLAT